MCKVQNEGDFPWKGETYLYFIINFSLQKTLQLLGLVRFQIYSDFFSIICDLNKIDLHNQHNITNRKKILDKQKKKITKKQKKTMALAKINTNARQLKKYIEC